MNFLYGLFMGFVVIQRVIETYRLPRRPPGNIRFAWSLTILTLLHLACILGSMAEFYSQRGIHRNEIVVSIGIFLYFSGMLLRNWAKYTLAAHWSLQIEIQPSHQIVRSGPYIYVRHPAYTAIMMEIVGIPLVAQAYHTLIFISIPYIFFLVWRAHLEERALLAAVGEPYRRFREEIPQFLPFIKWKSLF